MSQTDSQIITKPFTGKGKHNFGKTRCTFLKMVKQSKKRKQIKPRLVEHLSDDDEDEEIDEDEAFNSDDERKYGSFFQRPRRDVDGDEAEDGSDVSNDDDDESANDDHFSEGNESDDDDGGQYMLDLLNNMDGNNDDIKDRKARTTIATHVKESPFATSVISSQNQVSLNTLMEGLRDAPSYAKVQKELKPLARGDATAAPAERVVTERAKRSVHYTAQSKEISHWSEIVKENRHAETLDFRQKERLGDLSKDALTESFVPSTDFEKQLYAALEKAGQQDEEALLKAEEKALEDDLGANQMTIEEYKKRRGELARVRALMFYHEQKRHHINKIKSKKYRRIRKKQRERQKEAAKETEMVDNPDLEREMQEKEEYERMKERMTLAHKNTSAWAKRILRRGKHADVETRRALSAQLKRGDDLLKRMQQTTRGSDDEDSDEDLLETAKKVLADTENDDDEPATGLFKLSFMQRGLKRQREQAKNEARELLLELEENERLERSSGESDGDEALQDTRGKKSVKAASKEEMKFLLKDGEMVASSLKFGSATVVQVSGGIEIDNELRNPPSHIDSSALTSEFQSTHNPTSSSTATVPISEGIVDSSNQKQSTISIVKTKTDDQGDDSNPWLQSINDPGATGLPLNSSKWSRKTVANIDVHSAVDLLVESRDEKGHGNTKEEAVIENPTTGPNTVNYTGKKIMTMTQEELVRQAFAGITEAEADAEFHKEKADLAESEDPNRNKTRKQVREEQQRSSMGWGSWTGMGAPAASGKPRKLPAKLQPPKILPKRKRRDEAKPRVILSERRVKRLAESFMLSEIPYPYRTREEYERAVSGPIGREWNVTQAHKDATRVEVQTQAGKIIQPLSDQLKKKSRPQRAAAKF